MDREEFHRELTKHAEATCPNRNEGESTKNEVDGTSEMLMRDASDTLAFGPKGPPGLREIAATFSSAVETRNHEGVRKMLREKFPSTTGQEAAKKKLLGELFSTYRPEE